MPCHAAATGPIMPPAPISCGGIARPGLSVTSRTVRQPFRISESRQEELLDPKGASATRLQIERLLEANETADWAA